ncbi:hypothetical protein KPL76_05190 [Subtercola sp. PAMC28395]|uniref:hypothetical protein n=1 Tax=Subtercola sp. PAMC28395 TaxID=2846775 RepID=UPI001C0D309A|nr:hypothetical protein [Subtercola sp. PAMC28395]QWT24764.1 hypothetical protein KPL76_05190 [Subtercola sp. PAMC28395]
MASSRTAHLFRATQPASIPAGPGTTASELPAPVASATDAPTHTIHFNGNDYVATTVMTEIFRRRAQRIVDRGESELVPLLHSRGVELLLITPTTEVAVVPIQIGTGTALRPR